MKASEIIVNIEKRIKLEEKAIEIHNTRLDMLLTILHMAKKDGYIEKKEKALPPPLNPNTSFNKETV